MRFHESAFEIAIRAEPPDGSRRAVHPSKPERRACKGKKTENFNDVVSNNMDERLQILEADGCNALRTPGVICETIS
jgi:hypothetical protein